MDQVQKEDPAINLDYIKSLRVTADHCGFYPREAQIPRMVKLGMIISCDSMFINRSAPWLDVYGVDKANRIAPIHSMIAGGLMTTAEAELSDVETGTSETLHAQLSHLISRTNDRGQKIATDEGVDRNTLMKMSTTFASHYVLKEKDLGSLEPGKYADFVVYNKDYFTVPVDDIGSVYPLMTVLGGKTIVLRDEFAKDIGQQPVGPQEKWKYKTDFDFGAPVQAEGGF
jgi:predicted amidohydrolase YtcJ